MGRDKQRFIFETTVVRTVVEPNQPQSISVHADNAPHVVAAKSVAERITGLWNSTPVWGLVGVMLGAAAAQVSLWLIVFVAWMGLVIEFARAKFFYRTLYRIGAIGAFALILGAILITGIRLLPKSPALPTIDQEMGAFAQRFPGLREHDAPSVVQVVERAAPVPHLPAPVPDVEIELNREILGQTGRSHEDLMLFLLFSAVDRGAPGTVRAMQVELELQGKELLAVYPEPPAPNSRIYFDNEGFITDNTYWSHALSDSLLKPDAVTNAWIVGKIPNVSLEDVRDKHAVVRLTCIDDRGRKTYASHKFTGVALDQFTIEEMAKQYRGTTQP